MIESPEFGSHAGQPAFQGSIAVPALHGMLAWTQDPATAGWRHQIEPQVLYLARLAIPYAMRATKICVFLETPGTGLSTAAGETVARLYSGAGKGLAETANQSEAWSGPAVPLRMPITPTVDLGPGDDVYATVFCGSGTVMPAFVTGASFVGLVGAGLVGAHLRWAALAAGNRPPTNFNPAVITSNGAASIWMGVA